MDNGYLTLLAELGIDIPQETWNEVHSIPSPSEPPSSPILPSRPHSTTDDGLPVFTLSQLEWCEPELYGFTQYEVVEDEGEGNLLRGDTPLAPPGF